MVAALRPFFPLAMVLLGIGFAAVSVAPQVAADCHCSGIGCVTKVVNSQNNEDVKRDTNADGYLSRSEMGLCINNPRTDLWLGTVVLSDGATVSVHLITETVAADGEGSVFVARGANVTLGFVVEGNGTGNVSGNVTLDTPEGMALSGPGTVPFESGRGPALFNLVVDEEAPDLLAVPYTIRADGAEPYDGEVRLAPVDSMVVGGRDLLDEEEATEPAPGPGVLLALAALALAAVVAVGRRR